MQAKASLRATARLAGVSAVAILKTLDSVNLEPSKLAKMLMDSGFEAVNLTEWRTVGIPDMAIAIPGVNAGYRTPQDEYGTAIGKPSLIPDLKHFATEGRQVNICFDQDNKPETVQRVRTTISRMGRLLVNEGCSLRVIDLPLGAEKGVDDFIVAKGQPA